MKYQTNPQPTDNFANFLHLVGLLMPVVVAVWNAWSSRRRPPG